MKDSADLKTTLMGGRARPSTAGTSSVRYSQGTTTPAQPPAEPLAAVDNHGVVELTPDQALVTRAEAKIDNRAKKPACSNTKVHLMYGRGGGKSKRKSGGGKGGSGKNKGGSKRSSGKAGKKGKKGAGKKKGAKGSKSKAGRAKKTSKSKGKKAGKAKK